LEKILDFSTVSAGGTGLGLKMSKRNLEDFMASIFEGQRLLYIDHNPRGLSTASSFVLQSIHCVVTGLAFRRAREISSPHFSQTPKVLFSI